MTARFPLRNPCAGVFWEIGCSMLDGTTADRIPGGKIAGKYIAGLVALRARASAYWPESRLGRWCSNRQIGARLRAWWEGYEFVAEAPKPVVKGAEHTGPVEIPTINGWPPPRLEIVQRLFGEGMIAPAEAE